MSNLNIAVDVDEVLTNTNDYFLVELNKKFKTNIKKEQITDYYLTSLKDQLGEIHYETELTKYMKDNLHSFEIVDKAKTILIKLKEESRLHILSARGTSVQKQTKDWLNKEFSKEFFDKILFSKQENRKFSKAEICKMYDIDVLIEDAPHHAMQTAEFKVPVLLMDRPWNRHIEENEYIIRIYNWEDVESGINEIKTRKSKLYKYAELPIN